MYVGLDFLRFSIDFIDNRQDSIVLNYGEPRPVVYEFQETGIHKTQAFKFFMDAVVMHGW